MKVLVLGLLLGVMQGAGVLHAQRVGANDVVVIQVPQTDGMATYEVLSSEQ
ncbi:MAG: hypothetical protein O3C57_02365 [Verrucomicrobia bacterium]|nr:hypothetical protein [Verrucomicrobiota bacterium]